MQESVAIVAALLAIIGNVPYLYDVLRGRVKPHPYTWLIWSIVSCIIFFGQLAKGAGWGVVPTAAAEIFTILIFIYSLRYGIHYITKTDTYFLIVALCGLIPWFFTKDPTISVIIAVSIDLAAFFPTIRKAARHRHTENIFLFVMNTLRHILTLTVIQEYNIATSLHSVAMIGANSAMTFVLLRTRRR